MGRTPYNTGADDLRPDATNHETETEEDTDTFHRVLVAATDHRLASRFTDFFRWVVAICDAGTRTIEAEL